MSLKTCNHLFFECVVAKAVWDKVTVCVGYSIAVKDIKYVTNLWVNTGDSIALNIIHAAILWVLWLTRNAMCFK
jgi:hypothetical protein